MPIITPPLSPLNAIPGLANFGPQQLPHARRGLAAVASGTGRSRILCVGDSTTIGTGSVSGGVAAGLKLKSWPNQLAAMLAARGMATCTESGFGDGGYGANIFTYDSRFALGSWTQNGGISSLGGQSLFASSTTATPASWTPLTQTDTCEIYYAQGATGSINANINGGANTLQSTAGAYGVAKLTLRGTLGNNTYNVSYASGSNVFILGFIAYNSAVAAIDVINAGYGGATAEMLANNPWNSAAAEVAAVGADLTILQVGINDWIQAVALGTFETSLATLIAAGLATGDVLVLAPLTSNPASYSPAAQAPYLAAVAAAAAANGVPFADMNYRWTSFAEANALGFYYGDGVHGTALGYADEAKLIAGMLVAA